MKPLITIIVPVYKVERYISQCIESVLSQTFTDFELLLLDDGSPDSSGKICDLYAAIDKRVKVFHKKNTGVSDTRNFGLKKAMGDYVTFVDSDDWIDNDYLSSMIEGISKDADLVVSGFVLEKNGVQSNYKVDNMDFLMTDAYSFHTIMEKRLLYGPWAKLFKRKIVSDNGIYFPLGICYGEDRLFNSSYLYHVQRVIAVDRTAYHYRIHSAGSLSSAIYSNMFDLEYGQWKAFYELYKERQLFTETNLCYHWHELFWILADHLTNIEQWKARKTYKEKYAYLKHILDVPEITELLHKKQYVKDAPSFLFFVVARKCCSYFFFKNYMHENRIISTWRKWQSWL